jgi:RNA polymerase sigma factor (sigma-70 family)
MTSKSEAVVVREQALAAYLANRNDRTRAALVEANIPLVHYIVRHKFNIVPSLMPDAVSEGTLSLFRAADLYQPEQGNFSMYAAQWVRAGITKLLRHEVKQGDCRTVSRKESIAFRNETVPLDAEEAQQVQAPEVELREDDRAIRAALIKSIKGLDERSLAVLEHNIMGDRPLSELASQMGVTKQRLGQIRTRVITHLRSQVALQSC